MDNSRPTVTPTSYSEIDAWSVCRQKWYWLYVKAIEPRVAKRTPSFGSCGHAALAALMSGQDWNLTIDNWLKTEIAERQLFNEELEEFENIASVCRQVMKRYSEHYDDDFQVVGTEIPFEVPVPRTTHTLRGYFDAIVRDARGNLWLMETKFPASQYRSEDDIDLDGQLGVYQYAARRSGHNVVGIIYNQILAKVPKVPSVNRDGSISRSQILCDWPTYRQFVVDHLGALAEPEYYDMREKLKGVTFFKRYFRHRSDVEVKNFANNLSRRVWDLKRNKKHIYMSESRINCGSCAFKELCLATVKGENVGDLIELSYAPRRSRRDHNLSTIEADPE